MTNLTVPAFAAELEELLSLALAYPDQVTPHAYVTKTPQGEVRPHCLLGHRLIAQGVNPAFFDIHGGLLKRDGTRGLNNARYISSIWSEVYTRDALFLGLTKDESAARDFLTYLLYGHVQTAQDRSLPWKLALLRGLRSLKRKLTHGPSGFLVQTHGQHEDVLTEALVVLDAAIVRVA